MNTYITMYNLSVKLETSDHRLVGLIHQFLSRNYTVFQQVFGGSGEVNEVVYVSKIKNFNVWYFHVNQFKHLIAFLMENRYDVNAFKPNMDDKRDYKVAKTNFVVRSKWILRDEQKPVDDFLMNDRTGAKLVPLATGSGKAQPLTSLIKVPGGWVTMGEMQVGTVVTAKDGTPTAVTGVFPQGKTAVYKLTFMDGRTCEASDEHLWRVWIKDDKKEDKYQTVNTLRLLELTKRKTKVTYIDLTEPEKDKDIDLPIDPYLLGCLIGDGGFTGQSVKITNTNKKLIDKIKILLPESMEIVTHDGIRFSIVNRVKGLNKSTLIVELRKLGLWGKYSHEKFIPELYLLSSTEQRFKLLQGLMDTDGWVGVGSSIGYGTSSLVLCKHVQYLIRSLGGTASVGERIPQYTKNGLKCEGKLAYKIGIRHKLPEKLFTLEEKKNKIKKSEKRHLRLRLESVEYIGEKETQCISIDHPDKLYVTDNFVVTHNTFIAMNAVGKIKERMALVILPAFSEKWISDIVEIHEAKSEDIMLVRGGKSIAGLVGMVQEGRPIPDYIIFSSRTLQDFIRNFEEEPEECVEKYGCAPIDLFPLLGIGVLLIDETHMAFHAIFKIAVHTNVKYHIGLSATLISEDDTVTRAHRVMYPTKNVYGDTMQKRYMDIYPIAYNIMPNMMKFIKTASYGSTFYSHTAFEQSITKKGFTLDRYINIINNVIEDYYIEPYMEGDKLIIFVATVNLASILTERLADEYPDKVVKRYCEGDSYDEMLTGDFIVTTVISAGTGLDIPNLRVAIQTVSIASIVSNIQSAGRLRYLKDRDVKFCYIYAENIPKQKEFHLKRLDIFKDRAANISMRRSRVDLN